jgi:hypothetical protein
MSNNGPEHKHSSPHRPRHQISRSISELSPMRLHRHHNHGSHSRRDRASERDDQIHYTRSAGGAAAYQPRTSLDVPKLEADTPRTLSPDQSRRTSIFVPVGDEQMGAPYGAGITAGSGTTLYTRKLSRDEELQQERLKAAARARFVHSVRLVILSEQPSFRLTWALSPVA